MYLPLAYVNRYSLLTDLYCDEEHFNCTPEELIEMISDDNWGTEFYSGVNRDRYMGLYNMFEKSFFPMHEARSIQCLSPAKKHKLYKSSINKSIHFVQRSLSSSTRG